MDLQTLTQKYQELEAKMTALLNQNINFNRFLDLAGGNLKIPTRDATPATCKKGELVNVAGTVYVCSAQDTWTAVGGVSGGYNSVQEEGSALTARTKLNFIGAQVTAADDSANTRTNVTIGVTDANLSTSDVTTNDVSTSKHGFAPKVTDTAKFLKGDGTWASVSAGAVGSDTEIQFNDGGSALGTDPGAFLYDKSNKHFTIGDGSTSVFLIGNPVDEFDIVSQGALLIRAKNQTAGNATGGGATYSSGAGHGANNGGALNIDPGAGGATGAKGDTKINSGTAIATGANGGFLVIPKCAGTPSGSPGSSASIVYDTAADKIWIYNGSWRSVAVT